MLTEEELADRNITKIIKALSLESLKGPKKDLLEDLVPLKAGGNYLLL